MSSFFSWRFFLSWWVLYQEIFTFLEHREVLYRSGGISLVLFSCIWGSFFSCVKHDWKLFEYSDASCAGRSNIGLDFRHDHCCFVEDQARWWMSDAQVEPSRAGGCKDLWVVSAHQWLHDLIPFSLVFDPVTTETSGDFSVVVIVLPVCLRLISGGLLGRIQRMWQTFSELSRKMGVTVVQYHVRYLAWKKTVVENERGNIWVRGFRYRNSVCQRAVIVCYIDEVLNVVAILCGWS